MEGKQNLWKPENLKTSSIDFATHPFINITFVYQYNIVPKIK